MKLILVKITWSYRFLATRIAQPLIGYRWKCSLSFPYCTALCRILCCCFSHCWRRCWVLFSFCSSKSNLFLYFIFLCSLVSLLSSLCVRLILFSQFCCFYMLCCVYYFPISLYQLCYLSPHYQEDMLCLSPSVYCGTIPQLSYLCVP